MSSAICFNLGQSKILSSGKGLNIALIIEQVFEISDRLSQAITCKNRTFGRQYRPKLQTAQSVRSNL